MSRRAGRRYWHAVAAGKPCWVHMRGGPRCLRCIWKQVTGGHKRDFERERAHMQWVRDNWDAITAPAKAPRSAEQTSGVVGGAGIEYRPANGHTEAREGQ